jgi:drug/metabolite transporter (DMT)-like permease
MTLSALCTKESLSVGMWMLLNVVSVVGVIAANKLLYKPPYEFRFASSLMAFHFLCTWGFVVLARKLGVFTSKKIELGKYVRLGAAQTGSVGFINLSLLHNSVGMYQVLKFNTILVICFIEYFWKGKTYATKIYLSLIALVVGIMIATVTEASGSTMGILCGALGSLSTAIYQIYNKSIQVECDVKPLQLLEYEQPFTTVWAIVFAVLTEDVKGLLTYPYTLEVVALLLISGVFAFGVNVTCYTMIGKTSPVTYGVLGHTKTVCVFLFGLLVMQERPGIRAGAGMLLAFIAIVWYTSLSTSPSPPPPTANPKTSEEAAIVQISTNEKR